MRPGLDQRASTAGDRLRGQIRPQASGCGPSLYDPQTADKTAEPWAGLGFHHRAVRPPEHGCVAMCRCPSPVSVWPGAGIAPDRGKPLACGICHAPCLLPVLPVTGDGGAFLRVRCRRYRHSQVSDNRSNLNF